MGLSTSYSASPCLSPLGLLTRCQCSAASGRPAHNRALEQPAEPQHTPYVRAERARVDHMAPTLHPRTRGVHTERLRSPTSDPCIPARPSQCAVVPRPTPPNPPRHDDAREVHAGRSWGGRTVRGDHPRPQGHRLGHCFRLPAGVSQIHCLSPLSNIPAARARAAVLRSGARRAVRAALGDAAAPFRWRTGSMDVEGRAVRSAAPAGS